MANDDLLQAASAVRPCRADIRALIPLLPAEAEALEALIDRLNEERVARPFSAVVLAALAAGRPLPARHLVRGAALFEDAVQLAGAALHMEGNVAEALVQAVESGRMGWNHELMALMVAAAWFAQDPGRKAPPGLLAATRARARDSIRDPVDHASIRVIFRYLPDERLFRLLEDLACPPTDEIESVLMENILAASLADPLGGLPERPPTPVQSGFTVRRAAPKLGRNDPCHCGSGRKYKQCCLAKDQERLQRSSEIPGVTLDELEQDPNRALTLERIEGMGAPELERIHSDAVPAHLRASLVEQLMVFREGDAALNHLEAWGGIEAPAREWDRWLYELTRWRRPDLIRRLLSLASPNLQLAERLLIETRLLLLDGDVVAEMELLENRIRELIDRPAHEAVELVGVAYALLHGRHPALGILVARGVAPSANPLDAIGLENAVLAVRDKLGMEPFDAIDDVLDLMTGRSGSFDDLDDDDLDQTRMAIEAKTREMDELKRRLTEAQHALERQDRLRARNDPTDRGVRGATPSETARPAATNPELRQRLDTLKEELKSRHAERNQLRRELQEARQEIALLQQPTEPTAGEADQPFDAVEREHVHDDETFHQQPVRLVAFPKGFHQRLTRFPRAVARQTLTLAGRLAAGEPAAFVGALRLKLDRDLLRQRVGQNHRLLFRLAPDTVQIVDLVDRKDFERRLKALA